MDVINEWGRYLDKTNVDEHILDGWNGLGQTVMDAGADITSLLGTRPNAVSEFFRDREQLLKDAEFFPGKTAPHVKMAGDLALAGGLGKAVYRKLVPKIDLRKLTASDKGTIASLLGFETAALAQDTNSYISGD